MIITSHVLFLSAHFRSLYFTTTTPDSISHQFLIDFSRCLWCFPQPWNWYLKALKDLHSSYQGYFEKSHPKFAVSLFCLSCYDIKSDENFLKCEVIIYEEHSLGDSRPGGAEQRFLLGSSASSCFQLQIYGRAEAAEAAAATQTCDLCDTWRSLNIRALQLHPSIKTHSPLLPSFLPLRAINPGPPHRGRCSSVAPLPRLHTPW